MSKRNVLLFGGIAFLLLLLFMWLGGSNTRHSWKEDYVQKSREPYGTQVLTQLLRKFSGGEDLIILKDSLNGRLSQHSAPKANYIFVGSGMYMTERDRNALLDFVEAGNNAFICCRTIPHDLMFYLYKEECGVPWDGYESHYDTLVHLNLDHPKLRMSKAPDYWHVINYETDSYDWRYIGSDYFCGVDSGMTILGLMDSAYINFARVKHGAGFFYLHSTPLAFSNFHLVRKEGWDYAQRVLSHLPDAPIYWDEYSQVAEAVTRRANDQAAGSPPQINPDSPLKYVLSQPPLTWAWYSLLAAGLLYLLFRAKRRQRMVPVVEPNVNTSLEFVRTIGQLYFMQNNHQKLALQKSKLFNGYVRERYNLIYREGDDQFFERLAARSEVPETLIRQIFETQENIKKSYAIGTGKLIDFHRLMEQFYKACK